MNKLKSDRKKLKIGYWIGNISIENGGVGPYAMKILKSLLSHTDVHKDIELIVFCDSSVREDYLELTQKYPDSVRISSIQSRLDLLNKIVKSILTLFDKLLNKYDFSRTWLKYLNPFFYWFASLDIDVLHVPWTVAPQYDLPYPVIVTMHDVQELHYPEYFSPEERAVRAKLYWESCCRSDAVMVSFNHVKQDLIKYFNLEESQVYVCSIPYEQNLLKLSSVEETETYSQKYAHLNTFLLYPAQTWQHKNHVSLIKALEIVSKKYDKKVDLICTGKKNSTYFPKIETYLKESAVHDRVHFLDIVPETELSWLYKKCNLVVIPTLYEAGSFPLYEAMSLGVPVICSSVTSLPETLGDSRFVFDPLDIEGMASLIMELLENSDLRNKNIVNGQERIEQLKTIDSSKSFIIAYENIIESRIRTM